MTTANKAQDEIVLDQVYYIFYLMQFVKNKDENNILALIDSSSILNAMTSTYAAKLDFKVKKANISIQKIDSFLLEIYDMVMPAFRFLISLVVFDFSRRFSCWSISI